MGNRIITIENEIVSVPASDETWMTQHQLADLLQCFAGKINTNVRAILKTSVLDETNVCRTHYYKNGNFVEQYNLEMIIVLAFRIRSRIAKTFRDWLMKKAIANAIRTPILICGNWNNIQLN